MKGQYFSFNQNVFYKYQVLLAVVYSLHGFKRAETGSSKKEGRGQTLINFFLTI